MVELIDNVFDVGTTSPIVSTFLYMLISDGYVDHNHAFGPSVRGQRIQIFAQTVKNPQIRSLWFVRSKEFAFSLGDLQ